MRVDKGHAIGQRIAAILVAVAGRQHFDLRQKLGVDEVGRGAQPLGIGAEGRMHVEAVAAARAGLVHRLHRRIAIRDEHDARQIAADQRLERGAQLRECVGQVAVEQLLRILRAGDGAALAEQHPLGGAIDDDIGDERRQNSRRWRRP